MIKGGKHFAVGKTKEQGKNNAIRGDTREFFVPRKNGARYFFFTLFACLLLALFGAAVLSVDYFGRAMSFGDEPTFVFNVTQEGEAKLTLLGRDYSADVSFLAVVGERTGDAANMIKQMMPKSVILMLSGIPILYEETASLLARMGQAAVNILNF